MVLLRLPWDLQNRRAILPAGGDFPITWTTVQDLARVVVEAVDYKGTWPENGGITGTRITSSELLRLIESIRGMVNLAGISGIIECFVFRSL